MNNQNANNLNVSDSIIRRFTSFLMKTKYKPIFEDSDSDDNKIAVILLKLSELKLDCTSKLTSNESLNIKIKNMPTTKLSIKNLEEIITIYRDYFAKLSEELNEELKKNNELSLKEDNSIEEESKMEEENVNNFEEGSKNAEDIHPPLLSGKFAGFGLEPENSQLLNSIVPAISNNVASNQDPDPNSILQEVLEPLNE